MGGWRAACASVSRMLRRDRAVAHLERTSEGWLLSALADGCFHSGTELGGALGLSRAGVGRAVARLRRYGLRVEAVRGRGYRIPGGYEPLTHEGLLAGWRDTASGPPAMLQVDFRPASTNDLAWQAQARGTSAVFAEGQRAGRGRQGRSWASPLGGVYASVARDFDTLPESPAPVALAVAVAIAHVLYSYGIAAAVKWPNDLQVDGRKIGGILTELYGEPQGPCRLVTGIGLNLHAPEAPGHLGVSPGGLQSRSGNGLARNRLAGAAAGAVASVAARFQADGVAPLLRGWDRLDALRGRQVILVRGSYRVAGEARGIDAQGRLRVRTTSGLEAFSSGEAQLAETVS